MREYGDKVIFLHKVVPGSADHSYGIQVAQMAGLPAEVTDRAKSILKNLEDSELNVYSSGKKVKGRIPPPEIQMTLFEMKDERLREEIRKMEVEKMTPLEALQKLAEIKKKLDLDGKGERVMTKQDILSLLDNEAWATQRIRGGVSGLSDEQ